MGANDAQRYIVKMEVFAAAGPLDLNEMKSNGTEVELADVLQALREADPDEIEDQTYRAFRFDVCDSCRRELIVKPLPSPG
jgi:hypothetical protein